MSTLTNFQQLLQEQIKHEFTASQQYLAVAVHYDDADLPQLAKYFYRHSIEERNHAMMIVQYFLDRDIKVHIPIPDPIITDFPDHHEPLVFAAKQEKEVTDQFMHLAKVARDDNDYIAEQFLLWFLREQVEEVANMNTLIKVSERAKGNTFDLETFVTREFPTTENPATEPIAAGGNL